MLSLFSIKVVILMYRSFLMLKPLRPNAIRNRRICGEQRERKMHPC